MHPNANCNCRYADVGCDKMEEVMDQISGKWKMRILFMVGAHGTLRYGELRRLLDGVTHKMLSNQLKELAADGLVERIDYGEVPPRVDYRLTPNGEALMPIFDDIQAYIRKNGRDYRFETAPNPVPELRDRSADNTRVGRQPQHA